LPFGPVTLHLPSQKSNCRNSGATQAGGWDGAGLPAGFGDSAHELEMNARANAIGAKTFMKGIVI